MSTQISFKHHLDELCDMLDTYGGRDKVSFGLCCCVVTFTLCDETTFELVSLIAYHIECVYSQMINGKTTVF